MAYTHRNELAKRLRALHISGTPLLLTNAYDAASATAIASHPSTKALATASFAIAATTGVSDPDLTLSDNLIGISRVAKVAAKHNLPLTVDLQDGYEDIAASITQAIEAGAVGANIEDENHATGQLRDVEDAVHRIHLALTAAREAGVPDFCLNARTDVLAYGGSIDDAIERGKRYLEAGAVTVFVWGGPKGRGVHDGEIRRLVEALDGRVNVKMNLREGYLNVNELGEMGVARVSVGPEMFWKAMEGLSRALEDVVRKAR
ncbi:2-methylisocitrate lyase [Fulvia fulva]|uniref:2-methylisocitrate lyase n=1 Tax=Passalora fulva TaxID=5499 RepID=A0A9Q8US26_PASFU|nr:2-methylisocitrate lyase [Fulvia fulva]KAK4619847.1 2-methylisocitrate lyase [Fulvia fulva]KAK4621119.1 2-methylisocitrate lyase [Fulvia fulva]UJO20348.1 2-methylisocitrate lyase [Fulvia fulva]WPV17106.1 2-methylisocitrate lyase [Fulvia fulva]WPV32553.1 2-methylisocitrate lyase [Fulvia fulva]